MVTELCLFNSTSMTEFNCISLYYQKQKPINFKIVAKLELGKILGERQMPFCQHINYVYQNCTLNFNKVYSHNNLPSISNDEA